MSDVEPVAQRQGGGHAHDWRVRPNQVIILVGDSLDIRVVCAICLEPAIMRTPPKPTPRNDDVGSWRKWRWDD